MQSVHDSDGRNRRAAHRKATRNLGIIRGSGNAELECLVLDISGTGARLQLTSGDPKPFQAPVAIPEQFVLLMTADRTEIECRITWRKGTSLGVSFQSGFRAGAVAW